MGPDDQPKLEYDLNEIDATTKKIPNQGSKMCRQSTIRSMVKLETAVIKSGVILKHKFCQQQDNTSFNKLDWYQSEPSHWMSRGESSPQRPVQTLKLIRQQQRVALRAPLRTPSFHNTGGCSIQERRFAIGQLRPLQLREWQGVTRLNDTAGQSLKALLLMLVTLEYQSSGRSGQTNWTAGVSPMTSQVSLCVMSRWSALSLFPARERMEERHVKALMSRTHQLGALVNEDNPQNGRQAAETATTDTMEGF
jgi:hypothetical protein